jgi:hypothetical protein
MDKMQHYRRNWMQHVNGMPFNRLPRVIKIGRPKVRKNQGRQRDFWECEAGRSQQVAHLNF